MVAARIQPLRPHRAHLRARDVLEQRRHHLGPALLRDLHGPELRHDLRRVRGQRWSPGVGPRASHKRSESARDDDVPYTAMMPGVEAIELQQDASTEVPRICSRASWRAGTCAPDLRASIAGEASDDSASCFT